MNAKNDINEGFIRPKIIISDWVDRTWYTLAFEKWLKSFFLRRLYLIISKSKEEYSDWYKPKCINQIFTLSA